MISITKVYADGTDVVTVRFSNGVTNPGPADGSFTINTTTPIFIEQPLEVRVRFPSNISPGDPFFVDTQPGWLSEELETPFGGLCEEYPS